jgi:hypothetical protein
MDSQSPVAWYTSPRAPTCVAFIRMEQCTARKYIQLEKQLKSKSRVDTLVIPSGTSPDRLLLLRYRRLSKCIIHEVQTSPKQSHGVRLALAGCGNQHACSYLRGRADKPDGMEPVSWLLSKDSVLQTHGKYRGMRSYIRRCRPQFTTGTCTSSRNDHASRAHGAREEYNKGLHAATHSHGDDGRETGPCTVAHSYILVSTRTLVA